MRLWAEVYNPSGVKVAMIDAIISQNAGTRLDEAGSLDIQCAVDEKVMTFLVRDNEVVLYGQEDDEPPLIWMYGKIVRARVQESADTISVSISGRDLAEELRWRTVGLGRTYNALTIQAIMDDLTSLVSGWTAYVEPASAGQLQTARFDGPKVWKAILKSADQMGLHVRLGSDPRLLEIGAFGESATTPLGETIRVMRSPSSFGREMYSNDSVLFVDSISLTEDSDPVVNWAIPMGAGEGSAATTLQYTTYRILNTDNTLYRAGTVPYFPIYRRVNGAGIVEYYIDASQGDVLHQDTLSFKEIGPVANSLAAKELASNMLANACIESLKRTRIANRSISLSVRKARVALRVGDKIRLTYKGKVDTYNDPRSTQPQQTYLDIDEDLWIMGVQRSGSDSGIITTLQVNTIDEHIKDDTDLQVELLDRSEVNNLSIQNVINVFSQSAHDMVQWGSSVYFQKPARFPLSIDTEITDIISVKLNFFTKPLCTPSTFDHTNSLPTDTYLKDYAFQVRESEHYPRDISLLINGVDVTSALGGPWAGSDATVNVTLDISSYIIDAVGGVYQNHTLEFRCGQYTGFDHIHIDASPVSVVNISHGIIYCNTRVKAVARPN